MRTVALGLCLLLVVACSETRAPQDAGAAQTGAPTESPRPDRSAWITLGGQRFEVELALDPESRFRGLSGRRSLARRGGLLFAFPRPQPLAMVMRDCSFPIDVVFLDAGGRVVALHAMPVEPPRGPDESPNAYEARLPVYASGAPAVFAIETAGGVLAELGVGVGDRVVLEARAIAARAR